MAPLNPRQPSVRSRKGGKSKSSGGLLGLLFRRRKAAPKPPRPQVMVTGAQRAWKWKRLIRNILLTGALLAGAGVGLWGGTQLLLRSTVFRLTDIKVSGNRITTQRQILDLAGLQQGGSLLRFDTKAAVARVESHPWVERAEIKANWPSAVEVVVTEFHPFALVNVELGKERHLRYLSRSGRLFGEAGMGQELDFPVITGVQAGKDIEGDRLVKGSLADAASSLLLLAAKGNAILPIQAISEVHVDETRGILLYLADRPFPVYFGTDRLQTKYYRLVKVLEQLYSKKQVDAVKEIRMDYLDDKVLVTGVQIDG